MTFGPEYTKIDTMWKRAGRQNVVVPGDFSLPEFEYLANNDWVWTEKVDGTNIRLHWNGFEVSIAGRTDDAQLPAQLIANLRPRIFGNVEPWEKQFGSGPGISATVCGEGYGAGIRSGGNYRPDMDFIVFDVLVHSQADDTDWWLQRPGIEDVAENLGFTSVPLLQTATLHQMWGRIQDGNLVSAWKDCPIEGAVGKPAVEFRTRKGERLITKIKIKDWQDWRKANP